VGKSRINSLPGSEPLLKGRLIPVLKILFSGDLQGYSALVYILNIFKEGIKGKEGRGE
jgi:hypothetical protein